jgi:O-antigen/teichoic acid export membrane protein
LDIAKRVARNAVYRTGAVVIGNASGLLLAVVLARLLKPEHFGIYSLTLSIAMLASALANMGIDGAVIRYVAYHAGREDLKKLRGNFRYFLKIKIILAATISGLMIVLSGHIAALFQNQSLALPLMLSGFIVVFVSLTGILNGFFAGMQEFKFVFLKQTVYEFSRWIFIIPLSLLFLSAGAVAGIALAYLATFLLLLSIILKNYRKYIFGEALPRDEKAQAFVGFMTIAGISGIIYAYVDSLMIGYFIGTTEVGYYRAAYTIVFAIVGFLGMADVLFPVFTQLGGNDLSNAINRLARYTSAIAFPAAVGLTFLSKKIITGVYGVEYIPGALPLAILSFVLIPASFNYLLTVFNAKEIPEYSAYLITASMLLNVLLNYILINLYGIGGAAFATLISRVFVVSFAIFLLYRVLKLRIKIKVVVKPALCSMMMLGALLLLPEPTSLIAGVAEVTFGAIFYFILLFALKGLTAEDVRYIAVSLGVRR